MLDEFYVGDIDSASIPTKYKYKPPKQPHYNQDKTGEFIIKLLQFLVPLIILGVAVGVRFYTKATWLFWNHENDWLALWKCVSAERKPACFVIGDWIAIVRDAKILFLLCPK